MIERPPPMEFPYGVIEKALAVAYKIPDERRPVGFRGMISNLQKMGVLGPQSRVGRGAKLVYTHVEFNRLVLALEFSEFGIPPATAVALVEAYWSDKLKPIIEAAADPIGIDPAPPEGADVILYLGGVGLRTGSLRGETGPRVPIIERSSLDELPAAMKRWMAETPDHPAPRALFVNLSARMRAFHAALGVEYRDVPLDDREAAAISKAINKRETTKGTPREGHGGGAMK
jgi:hypothetical protein